MHVGQPKLDVVVVVKVIQRRRIMSMWMGNQAAHAPPCAGLHSCMGRRKGVNRAVNAVGSIPRQPTAAAQKRPSLFMLPAAAATTAAAATKAAAATTAAAAGHSSSRTQLSACALLTHFHLVRSDLYVYRCDAGPQSHIRVVWSRALGGVHRCRRGADCQLTYCVSLTESHFYGQRQFVQGAQLRVGIMYLVMLHFLCYVGQNRTIDCADHSLYAGVCLGVGALWQRGRRRARRQVRWHGQSQHVLLQ